MLYAAVEFDENISEFDLLTAGRLEGGINYTMAPMMLIEQLKDVPRAGYRGLRIPVGYISPGTGENRTCTVFHSKTAGKPGGFPAVRQNMTLTWLYRLNLMYVSTINKLFVREHYYMQFFTCIQLFWRWPYDFRDICSMYVL